MTNTDARTEFALCPDETHPDAVQILVPRLVPLGGPRAMNVRRTLPHRERSFVGAWCFVDHYGPHDVASSGGMDVPPHPHTGLQTVSWLFDGQIEHRDSTGVHAMVQPGEVNLMTAGQGIAHSEVSTPAATMLRGVQLWVVLPAADRHVAAGFETYAVPLSELAPGVRARVFIGELAGQASPIHTFSPLTGAEIHLDAGTRWTVEVPPEHEHALLIDSGSAALCGAELTEGELGIVDAGRRELTLVARETTRALLVGGTPFQEEVVMWWNFIAANHAEIEQVREQWQDHSTRFGEVSGYSGMPSRLPAPPMPGVRLRPRDPAARPGRAAAPDRRQPATPTDRG